MKKNIFNTIKKDLLFVEKPARYIGMEYGIPEKDFSKSKVKFALVFPEIYEIAMSNIAIKILYSNLNKEKDIACERVFHPWPDFENILIKTDIPLYSLETYTPVKEFDIVGFSIPYEILATNVLNILKLSKIPINKKDRNNNHPIILASGNGITNPIPFLDYIDVFFFGEADVECVNISNALKNETSKKAKLLKLSKIPGIYIPELNNKPVAHNIVKDFNTLSADIDFPVPNIQIIQDRVAIEIARGCSHGCRFCQAGFVYRPVRERSIKNIINSAVSMINKTGYDEISLISLSASDYSQLPALLKTLDDYFTPLNVNISLPSLRVDSFNDKIAVKLSKVRKSGLTFAVESANEETRKYINKNISKKQVLKVAEFATENGWNLIKLYFMIGIQGENEEKEIVDLIEEIISLNKKLRLNINIGIFVPKPLTPFEKNKQIDSETAWEKINWIKTNLKKYGRKISIKHPVPEISDVEGFLARGDENIGKVIKYVHDKGQKLDAWSEFFNYDIWMEALEHFNISKTELLNKNTTVKWHEFQNFISPDFLIKEKSLAERNETTSDCRIKCSNCGICDSDLSHKYAEDKNDFNLNYQENNKDGERQYVITEFSKTNIYIGHRDLMTIFQRTFRRSKINVVYTQGFNPRPKMQIPHSLPLGIYSDCEYLFFQITGKINEKKLIKEMNCKLPKGIKITNCALFKNKIKSIETILNYSTYKVKGIQNPEKFIDFLKSDMKIIKKGKEIFIKGAIDTYNIKEDTITLGINHSFHAGIRDIIDNIYDDWRNYKITRTGLFNKENGKQKDLIKYFTK